MTVETIQTHEVEDPAYSIIIPIRDRYGHMLRNCLKSIELQTLQPLELIIVDYGSTEENHKKLMQILPECTVYRYKTDAPWSLSTARNIGLRRATAKYSLVLDADLIMESRVLEVVQGIHNTHPRIYMSTRITLLSPASISHINLTLPQDYEKLGMALSTGKSEGWGGLVSAPTEWWYECQGFNERMKWWGWEDVDMWKRAARARMYRVRLNEFFELDTNIYHLYHPNVQIEVLRSGIKEIKDIIKQNEVWTKRFKGIKRNDENWGLWSED